MNFITNTTILTYKENEINDDNTTSPENDDQAENESEWLDLSWPQITCSSDQTPNPETTVPDYFCFYKYQFPDFQRAAN